MTLRLDSEGEALYCLSDSLIKLPYGMVRASPSGCWTREANHQCKAQGRSCFGSETAFIADGDAFCPDQPTLEAYTADRPNMVVGKKLSISFLF